MNVRKVKKRLAELGVRQVDLGKKWKLRPIVVNQFIHNKFASKRLEKSLANTLGWTVEELRGEKPKQPNPPEQATL